MNSTPESVTSISPIEEAPLVGTIASFRSEYLKADGFCQEVQSFLNLAGVPAVNELRNAGKHLLTALDDGGKLVNQAEMISAINHARRACYEAYEAGIMTALEMVDKFRPDYPTTTVGDSVPDYIDILHKSQQAQKAIETGRSPEFDKAADHSTRMNSFRELRDCAERLQMGREDMNKKVDNQVQGARNSTRDLKIGLITLALAILVVAFGDGLLKPLLSNDASEQAEKVG